jgi:hypothetical protein
MTVSSTLSPFFAMNSLISAQLAADLTARNQVAASSDFGAWNDSALPVVESPALQADAAFGGIEDPTIERVRELFDARL